MGRPKQLSAQFREIQKQQLEHNLKPSAYTIDLGRNDPKYTTHLVSDEILYYTTRQLN